MSPALTQAELAMYGIEDLRPEEAPASAFKMSFDRDNPIGYADTTVKQTIRLMMGCVPELHARITELKLRQSDPDNTISPAELEEAVKRLTKFSRNVESLAESANRQCRQPTGTIPAISPQEPKAPPPVESRAPVVNEESSAKSVVQPQAVAAGKMEVDDSGSSKLERPTGRFTKSQQIAVFVMGLVVLAAFGKIPFLG